MYLPKIFTSKVLQKWMKCKAIRHFYYALEQAGIIICLSISISSRIDSSLRISALRMLAYYAVKQSICL